jgi:hypothetical protein
MVHVERRRSLPAVVAGVLLVLVAGSAPAAEPTQQELLNELQALRAKVEKLEAAQTQQSNRLTAAEVDAVVRNVLEDADQRSQLFQVQGFTAGHNKGRFTIQSEDGNFVLQPLFQLQLRYVVNYREEDADNSIDGNAATEDGFEVSRMKLILEGNVFSPDTKYKFQWGTNRSGGSFVLEEAYVTQKLNFAPDFFIKAGQFKDPTFHEEVVFSRRQLAVDRSLANEVLAGGQTDWVQGVGVLWDDGLEGLPLRGEIGYTDGPNTDNTNFVDGGGSPAFGADSPDFGIHGRVEYLVLGDWRDYDDFSAMNNVQDLLVVGGGAFYTQAGDSNVIFHTVDAQYEMNKLGMYAAFYGVYSDNTAGGDSAYDVGGVAQVGYTLDKKWEPFARYSLVSLDSGGPDSDDNYHEFTAGVNYYMHGHAAKFTLDVTYLPDGVPSDQSQIGELDPDADGEQFVFRGQFQLVL